MNSSNHLSMSQYKDISILNETHKIYIVQHQETKKIFVKKILDVYNASIYQYLQTSYVEGTPQIIDLYEDDNSLTVIEEYISGETLQDKINNGSLDHRYIYYYIKELCTILNRLHSLNPPIIHRDIKPSNILITAYNHVVLLDFNAAKFFTNINSPDTILLGTQGYAAPEQYGFGSSTQQTDIYAIGVLLRELISSSKIPLHQFDSIISKCTQINPADRFTSVSELKDTLCNEPINKQNNSHVNPTKTKSWKFFLPPGFRTNTPWHMLVAVLGYIMIFGFTFSLKISEPAIVTPWLLRSAYLLIFLGIVFVCCNYLNIQKAMPLCQHKNPIIKHIGISLLNIILFFILIILLTFINLIFFS